MKKIKTDMSRRSFIKRAGALGLGAALTPFGGKNPANAATTDHAAAATAVAKRPFGRSGIDVPILSLGGMFDIVSNQSLLKQAIRYGITYWDTAHTYGGGQSEKGIGQFFADYPDQRDKIFLVTKSTGRGSSELSRELSTSLERMNTDHIDLFFVHGIRNADVMNDDIRKWGEKQKAAGKIRMIGFSTHANMERCLQHAARLGWIDGIMLTYNFRLMHEDKMKAAVDACVKAGIGLTAMKTQGGGAVKTKTARDLELAGRFVQRGFTDKQAKLKAVWENPQVSAICSQMPTMAILMANIAAAVDYTALTDDDRQDLTRYASETFSHYCAGCTQICENAVSENVPIGNVMRYLMYARNYSDTNDARRRFALLSASARRDMARADYTLAEARCPRRLPIGRLMSEAADELA